MEVLGAHEYSRLDEDGGTAGDSQLERDVPRARRQRRVLRTAVRRREDAAHGLNGNKVVAWDLAAVAKQTPNATA